MNASALLDSMLSTHFKHVPIPMAEKVAIQATIEAGESHGFGNLISWLATAWAVRLREGGMKEKDAIAAVSNCGNPYPLPKAK